MIILSVYGKIPRTIISKKLGVAISNLPKDWEDGIQEDIREELHIREFDITKYKKYANDSFEIKQYDLIQLLNSTPLQGICNVASSEDENIKVVAENLIGISVDDFENSMLKYKNDSLDSPSCEAEYCVKFLRFLNYIRDAHSSTLKTLPRAIYVSDNYNQKPLILNYLSAASKNKTPLNVNKTIEDMVQVGKYVDDFLQIEDDFWKLDYLINAIAFDNDYNASHLFRTFTLIEMLLINPKNGGKTKGEISQKMPQFMKGLHSLSMTEDDKSDFSELARTIRNKIAHGDFAAVRKNLQLYEDKFMKSFFYDEFEHSRESWNFISICCELDETLKNILWMMLTDRQSLENIQFDKTVS